MPAYAKLSVRFSAKKSAYCRKQKKETENRKRRQKTKKEGGCKWLFFVRYVSMCKAAREIFCKKVSVLQKTEKGDRKQKKETENRKRRQKTEKEDVCKQGFCETNKKK